MADSVVIIPTYNERENVEKMVRKVFSLAKEFHILIIDDNSPDGTAKIIEGLNGEFNGRLFMIRRPGKLGLGTAYTTGFKWALERDYQYIFEMDCDFSHNPDDLVKLYSACKNNECDLAIGSRYIKGVNVVNWPIGRILMSYFASTYVRLITRMKVRDTTAGFKCFHRRVLEAIKLNEIQFTGYAFQIEMKYIAWKLGFRIKEISIVFTDRAYGESKMSKGIFKEAVFGVIKLRLQRIQSRYDHGQTNPG